MSFGAHELERIETALAGPAIGVAAIAELRRHLPGLSVSHCDASDVCVERPFRTYPAFDLHLVDGRDHCWRLTSDPESATGVMIAMRRIAR